MSLAETSNKLNRFSVYKILDQLENGRIYIIARMEMKETQYEKYLQTILEGLLSAFTKVYLDHYDGKYDTNNNY